MKGDKLCDRIAIVDHGTLCLGTPIELKHSVPEPMSSRSTSTAKQSVQERLEGLDGVTSVQAESAGFYRVLTSSGSRTPCSWSSWPRNWARPHSLSVQNTSLDDVFVHYTGRNSAMSRSSPPPSPCRQARSPAMSRMFAIVEREMRKFFRSPTLMIMS